MLSIPSVSRTQNTMTLKYCLVLVISCCFVVGCGGDSGHPKTYPVTGSVKLNGKPVEGAVVAFQLAEGKANAIGSTDAKGEYTLSTFVPADGAVAGQYRVAISKFSTPPPDKAALQQGVVQSGDLPADYAPPGEREGGAAGASGPKNLLPAKYANDQTSALRATVTESGPNKFDFDLK
jgi:hypothetical protein